MDAKSIKEKLNEILELSSRKVEEINEKNIGGSEKTAEVEPTLESESYINAVETVSRHHRRKSATSIRAMSQHYLDVMGISDDNVHFPEDIRYPSEINVVRTLLAVNTPNNEDEVEQQRLDLETNIETDTQQATKSKTKGISFGLSPALDMEELKEKLKERNEAKLEQMNFEEKSEKNYGQQVEVIMKQTDDDEVDFSVHSECDPKVSESICACAFKQSKSSEVTKLPQHHNEQSIEFQNRPRDPVAFGMLPEEEYKNSIGKIGPDMKFYFGSSENLNGKLIAYQEPGIEQVEIVPVNLSQMTDTTQSVIELVENVQEAAKMLLIDTTKVLEGMARHDDMYFALPQKIDPYELKLPLTTKLKQAAFGFAPEEELRELKETQNSLKQPPLFEINEEGPEPQIEYSDNLPEELSAKIFENPQELLNYFDTNEAPTFPNLKGNMALDFDPESGQVKFEKRSSSQEDEMEVIENLQNVNLMQNEEALVENDEDKQLTDTKFIENLELKQDDQGLDEFLQGDEKGLQQIQKEQEISTLNQQENEFINLQQAEEELKLQQQAEETLFEELEKKLLERQNKELIKENDMQSSLQIQQEDSKKVEKTKNQKGKLRRTLAAEDLTMLGASTEQICACYEKRAVPQSPLPSSEENSVADVVIDKMSEYPYSNTGAIRKVFNIEKTEKAENRSKIKWKQLEERSKLTKVTTLTSLHQQETFEKSIEKPKNKKSEDDDGYLNLPDVPSTEISEEMSSVWIDENVDFNVDEKQSPHTRAPLGQVRLAKAKKSTHENIDEIVLERKKKQSKLLNCKCFMKRMSKIFRKSKE